MNIIQNNSALDSDSQSSEQQQGSILYKRQKRKLPIEICIIFFVLCAIVAFIFIVYLHRQSRKQIQTASIDDDQQQTENLVVDKQDATKFLQKSQSIRQSSASIKERFGPIIITNYLTLPKLSINKQFGNSFFVQDQQKGGINNWFDRREIKCQANKIINSASKISQNEFIQKTAYEGINVLLPSVTIPAEHIYEFQGIRQLLQNLTKQQERIIAINHYSPLVLIIATIYSKNGIFVSNDSDWKLLQKNLIINDVFLLAKPLSFNQIVNSNGYSIMISNNLSLIKSMLYQGQREIIVIIDLRIPVQVETYLLLGLKIYRIQHKDSCQARNIEMYEQSSWHFDNKTNLLPDWYIFTISSLSLPLHFEKKDYRKALWNPRHHRCILNQNFIEKSLTINGKYTVKNLPFEGLHFLAPNSTLQTLKYKQVLIYFLNNPPKQIFINSGPLIIIMLLISTLEKNSPIRVNADYKDILLLRKNLVLNNLQRELLVADGKTNKDLLITNSAKDLDQSSAQRILFIASGQMNEQFPSIYKIFKFVEQEQCRQTILQTVPNKKLSQGIYILTSN